MLGQSKTAHQAEIDAACELIDFLRFNVEFMTRIYEEQPHLVAGRRGTGWSTGRSRASSSPSRRSTSRRSAATCPTSAGADGQHGRLEAGLDRGALGALRHAAARRRPGCRRGVINLVYGRGAEIGDAALASPRPRRRPLHRLDAASSRGCGRRSATTSSATATTRGSSARPAARTSSSRTLPPTSDAVATAIVRGVVRVPGPEVLGRLARVRAVEPLAGRCASGSTHEVASIRMGDVADFGELHGRRHRRQGARGRSARRSRRRARTRDTEIVVGGGVRRQRGLLRRADRDRDARPATSA